MPTSKLSMTSHYPYSKIPIHLAQTTEPSIVWTPPLSPASSLVLLTPLPTTQLLHHHTLLSPGLQIALPSASYTSPNSLLLGQRLFRFHSEFRYPFLRLAFPTPPPLLTKCCHNTLTSCFHRSQHTMSMSSHTFPGHISLELLESSLWFLPVSLVPSIMPCTLQIPHK